ncbi:hypothetical protein B0F90DRAFT_1670536 [Multifurca ochricompacta]|uniref:C2H2-type domain-containing protein n=1 Tax=Multifurca ochricompacta TaxID=376703 RepID=A0AAD4LZA7_9AGAM|nr:hypothetical protein B0F90DRAFT_1670536 [Multifurca ochricompacta]
MKIFHGMKVPYLKKRKFAYTIVRLSLSHGTRGHRLWGIGNFSFPPQKTEVDREDIPELSFYFPPVAPIQSDPTSGHGWPELDSGFSCEAAHGSYYPTTALTQECWENYHQFSYAPLVQGDLYGTFPHPTGMNADIPMGEAMDGSQDAYDMFHLRSLARHSALKGHKYDPAPHQLGGQEPYDRRFTCTFPNCGKRFSGEWEKSRHVKSMHCPPTIGCRKCNYKQSRKDLFSEHCKKRHPGESIEDLRVRLDTPGA